MLSDQNLALVHKHIDARLPFQHHGGKTVIVVGDGTLGRLLDDARAEGAPDPDAMTLVERFKRLVHVTGPAIIARVEVAEARLALVQSYVETMIGYCYLDTGGLARREAFEEVQTLLAPVENVDPKRLATLLAGLT